MPPPHPGPRRRPGRASDRRSRPPVASDSATSRSRPLPPGNTRPASSSKFLAAASNVSSKVSRICLSVSRIRPSSSRSAVSRSVRWVSSSSTCASASAYSSCASGLTGPSCSRRFASRSRRVRSSSRRSSGERLVGGRRLELRARSPARPAPAQNPSPGREPAASAPRPSSALRRRHAVATGCRASSCAQARSSAATCLPRLAIARELRVERELALRDRRDQRLELIMDRGDLGRKTSSRAISARSRRDAAFALGTLALNTLEPSLLGAQLGLDLCAPVGAGTFIGGGATTRDRRRQAPLLLGRLVEAHRRPRDELRSPARARRRGSRPAPRLPRPPPAPHARPVPPPRSPRSARRGGCARPAPAPHRPSRVCLSSPLSPSRRGPPQ